LIKPDQSTHYGGSRHRDLAAHGQHDCRRYDRHIDSTNQAGGLYLVVSPEVLESHFRVPVVRLGREFSADIRDQPVDLLRRHVDILKRSCKLDSDI